MKLKIEERISYMYVYILVYRWGEVNRDEEDHFETEYTVHGR